MHCCGMGGASAKIKDNSRVSPVNPMVTVGPTPKIGGELRICMPNVIPYLKIFPRRSPKAIILGGGVLFFYLMLPGQGLFLPSLALASSVPMQFVVAPTHTTPTIFLAKTPTPTVPMLPQAIADKVLQDLAQRSDQPRGQFKIESSAPSQWPNSCLGLAQPDEFCAQMITPGWRVQVNDGKKTWIYRTDQWGKTI